MPAPGTAVGGMRRGAFVSIATAEIMEFLFSPEQLPANLQINYARQQPIASSYTRLHYTGTGNVQFPIELLVSRQIIAKRFRNAQGVLPRNLFQTVRDEFNRYHNFLWHMGYPRGGKSDLVRRAPSRYMFIWPRTVAMEVIVTGLQVMHQKFAESGESIEFKATVNLEEVRDYRLTSAQVRREGLFRPGGVLRGVDQSLANSRRPVAFDPAARRGGGNT